MQRSFCTMKTALIYFLCFIMLKPFCTNSIISSRDETLAAEHKDYEFSQFFEEVESKANSIVESKKSEVENKYEWNNYPIYTTFDISRDQISDFERENEELQKRIGEADKIHENWVKSLSETITQPPTLSDEIQENEESSTSSMDSSDILFFYVTVIISLTFIFTCKYIEKTDNYRDLRSCLKIRELADEGVIIFPDKNKSKVNANNNMEELAIGALPYYTNINFSTDGLVLEELLGTGAYGTVHKGIAKDIYPNQNYTQVAVKIPCGPISYEAQARELKILSCLDRHVNVVSLLGAVTNVEKGELKIIVEYCQHGNIRDFLRKNREHFIDQTKCTGNVNSNEAYERDPNYIAVVQIEQDDRVSFTTTDLLCWAFQVTQGMQHLASQNILHGDLAARNVLLCADGVVKICDFGLAHSLTETGNHMKNETTLNTSLLSKWMAPELLSNDISSSTSDIWSYGILLWELFSLGMEPYADLETEKSLHSKLIDGFRMEKPQYATDYVYCMMLSCWLLDPKVRPTFKDIEISISKLIGNKTAQHLIDINEPYRKANEFYKNAQYTLSMEYMR